MSGRRIYIVSPREPSGATWLINCFLELGIRTYRIKSLDQPKMWSDDCGISTLKSHEEMLKKWLPALSAYKTFKFRDDIEVIWTHEWPSAKFDPYRVIYFIRDPRDSLFSRYKREAPDQTFEEFLAFPDISTLLNKVDNWCLYNRCWLEHIDLKVFRFEDYKKDAAALLIEILCYMGLEFSAGRIDAAIEASASEKAAASEKSYMETHPKDRDQINRGGKVGSWKELDSSIVSSIERKASSLLLKFGYEKTDKNLGHSSYASHTRLLSFFKNIRMPSGLKEEGPGHFNEVMSFAYSLNAEAIGKSGLRDWEVRILVGSLSEFIHAFQSEADERFSRLFNSKNNAEYFVNLFRLTGNISPIKRSWIFYRLQSALNRFKKE